MNIFLTGATGLVGGELLVNLSGIKSISKIYCLVRAENEKAGIERLKKVFNLRNDPFDPDKIIAVPGDLRDKHLTDYLKSRKDLNHVDFIIHSAANTSFSRIYNVMVEEINVHGLNKVVQWAKSIPFLTTFMYIGTATICGKDFTNRVIFEDDSPNIHSSHLVKYTYTKMQGELLLQKELPPEKLLIARPSIIMGDSRDVAPRSPVILWALAVINTLRLCPFQENKQLDIISADFAADALIKLLFAKRNHSVYHISSGIEYATTPKKTLSALEPFFSNFPDYEFLCKSSLQQMKNWARRRNLTTDALLPYNDYLQHWENMFEDRNQLRIIFSGLEPYVEFIELGHVFDNTRLLNDVEIAPPVPAHDYIGQSVEYIKSINLLEGAFDS